MIENNVMSDIQSAKIKKINHSRHIGTAADIGTGIALIRVKAESSTKGAHPSGCHRRQA